MNFLTCLWPIKQILKRELSQCPTCSGIRFVVVIDLTKGHRNTQNMRRKEYFNYLQRLADITLKKWY